MSKGVTEKQHAAINSIAALVLLNAMIFQEVLSKKNSDVKPLQAFRKHPDPVSGFADHWKFILDEINYHPIFYVAHQLLICLSADKILNRAICALLESARRIVDWRASLRHDLAGRLYHRLLADAKHLGAYYTSIPCAVLLLKLALRRDKWKIDWSNLAAVKDLRIADLACGTGTLLMAAADAAMDNHVRACVDLKKRPSLTKLHSTLVESILWGFDVLPSAIHLTASTLTLRVPEVPLNVTNLRSLTFGGPALNLGSLDFIESPKTKTPSLFTVTERVRGKKKAGDSAAETVSIPPLDLCVMNPPFTSSRQPNLLFGTIPDKDRLRMQKKLQTVVRKHKLAASITAGLGSVFVALADRYLREGGRLALVLPRAMLSGVAWGKTRQLIGTQYDLEYLVVSHEPDHWNFSENTALSEVVLVARKRPAKEKPSVGESVTVVNLWRQPRTMVEALSVASQLVENLAPEIIDEIASLQIMVGDRKCGEAVRVRLDRFKGNFWHFPCAFAQTEVGRALMHLVEGELYLPGEGVRARVPVRRLGDIANLGPDPRDVYDGFDLVTGTTAYPALWGHEVSRVFCMQQTPNQYLQPLAKAKADRPLRRLGDLWPKAAQLLIAQRVWLNTKSLVAVRVTKRVLSDVWWPVSLTEPSEQLEKTLALWLNSTLGLLLWLGHREETRGAWVQFKKPVLKDMPVLDVQSLSTKHRAALVEGFSRLASKRLLPFPKMAEDPVRVEIDQVIARALDLPDFSILRELLAREPIISLTMQGLLPA